MAVSGFRDCDAQLSLLWRDTTAKGPEQRLHLLSAHFLLLKPLIVYTIHCSAGTKQVRRRFHAAVALANRAQTEATPTRRTPISIIQSAICTLASTLTKIRSQLLLLVHCTFFAREALPPPPVKRRQLTASLSICTASLDAVARALCLCSCLVCFFLVVSPCRSVCAVHFVCDGCCVPSFVCLSQWVHLWRWEQYGWSWE